jgi:hypothetical protein
LGRTTLSALGIHGARYREREALRKHKEIGKRLDELERKLGAHDGAILVILKALRELTAPAAPATRRPIGFVRD